MYVVTPDELKELRQIVEKEIGIKSLVLTENAGRTAFSILLEEIEMPVERAVVIAGAGNNGAEGLVVARYLLEKARDLTVFLVRKKKALSRDLRENLKLFKNLGGKVIEVKNSDVNVRNKIISANLIIDALFGTGFRDWPKGVFKDIIYWINDSRAFTLSIDIPSGVNPYSGEVPIDAVYADLTVTMVFPKIGNIFYPGKLHTGKLVIADTGIPEKLVGQKVRRSTFEEEDATKYILTGFPRGRVVFIGKRDESLISSSAAIKSGAATSYVVVPRTSRRVNISKHPNIVELPVDSDDKFNEQSIQEICNYGLDFSAMVIGFEGNNSLLESNALLKALEKFKKPIVIDSPGDRLLGIHLNCIRNRETPAILMVNTSELSHMLDRDIQWVNTHRFEAGRDFAVNNNLVLILKGAPTVVFTPDGFTWINSTGTPGLAAGSTGNVLTGIIAGLLSQGFKPDVASILAVFLHGLAADIGVIDLTKHTIIAGDLIKYIPEAIKYLKDYEDADED